MLDIFKIVDDQKVTVTEDTSICGWDFDVELVRKHLVIGQVYTIDFYDIGVTTTCVYLKEVPFVPFNSLNFVMVEEIEVSKDNIQDILNNVIKYCEDKDICDKLAAYGDFYYKIKYINESTKNEKGNQEIG